MKYGKYMLLILATLLAFGCKKFNKPRNILLPITEVLSASVITLDPSGACPLCAYIDLELMANTRVRSISMLLIGQDGSASDISQNFSLTEPRTRIPVLGLYGGFNNRIDISFLNKNGFEVSDTFFMISTDSLISDLPEIETIVAPNMDWDQHMTLVSYYGFDTDTFPQKPFIMDQCGKIRWYLNFNGHPILDNTNYANGIERLKNGNFIFGTTKTRGATGINGIFEIDIMGHVINSWPLHELTMHHQVIEKPNGNLLATVYDTTAETIEDIIIELDRSTGNIVSTIDLNESLNVSRKALLNDDVDWIHVNSIFYDEDDETIILSGRTQGVIKITEENEVVWIIAAHKDWGIAQNGQDLNDYLLHPLDSNDRHITDTSVLMGYSNHKDFEWPWFQHSAKQMPNGDIIMFDNGSFRNYKKPGVNSYSQSIEYRIDPESMTIKQIWSYGKERGDSLFAGFLSDVDYFRDHHSVISSHGTLMGETGFGKVVEVDYLSKNVIYEANILPPNVIMKVVTLHRTERLKLYPEKEG